MHPLPSAAYATAYAALETLTPMRFDCGRLCEAACCRESATEDEVSGMYLYPGEEAFLRARMAEAGDSGNWMRVLSAPLDGETQSELLLCAGHCPRPLRPLACRIFPLVPYLDAKGRLRIRIDPRGRALCPLRKRSQLDPAFVAAMEALWPPLLADQAVYDFVWRQSRTLDEWDALRKELGESYHSSSPGKNPARIGS